MSSNSAQAQRQPSLPDIGSGPSLEIAILSISGPPTPENGWRGIALANRVLECGHRLTDVVAVPDEPAAIREQVQQWIDAKTVDVVLAIDDSDSSSEELPPEFSFTSEDGDIEHFTSLMHDTQIGFVGVINIRLALDWAATPSVRQDFGRSGQQQSRLGL